MLVLLLAVVDVIVALAIVVVATADKKPARAVFARGCYETCCVADDLLAKHRSVQRREGGL